MIWCKDLVRTGLQAAPQEPGDDGQVALLAGAKRQRLAHSRQRQLIVHLRRQRGGSSGAAWAAWASAPGGDLEAGQTGRPSCHCLCRRAAQRLRSLPPAVG